MNNSGCCIYIASKFTFDIVLKLALTKNALYPAPVSSVLLFCAAAPAKSEFYERYDTLYLKETNDEDAVKEFLFVRDMPTDENGLTNKWNGI